MKRESLRDLHQRWITPSNMAFSVVGGISPEEFQIFLEKLNTGLSAFSGKNNFKAPTIEPEHKLTAPRWGAANYNREQTHILVGGLGLSMFDESRYALRIAQNILGGQSGRLFIELREKRSMAYTVSPMNMEGLEPGYVGTYIACSPQKSKEAIEGIHTVLSHLADKGPTSHEMIRAKNYYLGQRAMDLQSTWALASSYGLELLYRGKVLTETEIRKEIERITPKSVQKMIDTLLLKAPQVTITVG